MTPDEWQAVPKSEKLLVAARVAYQDIDAAVKFLCDKSQKPGDAYDMLAMRLGASGDRIYDALPDND